MEFVRMLAEEKIKQAISDGEFDQLPGQGAPLELDGSPLIPDHTRASAPSSMIDLH